jgi:hypothetical protein
VSLSGALGSYALALLAALLGAALGFALGSAAADLLAPALGITSFEGASGYFAVFVGGPLGALVGLVSGALLVLRRAGPRGVGALAGRLVLVVAGVVGVGAAVLGGFWVMRPLVNANGPAPQLVFEIRLPPAAAPSDAKAWAIELQTSRNRMPATLEAPRRDEGRDVIVGSVELYYRTWRRTLVLTMPDKTDVLFDISLGLSPGHARAFGAWQRADYIARPGDGQARRTTAADLYEIRYRTEWVGDD